VRPGLGFWVSGFRRVALPCALLLIAAAPVWAEDAEPAQPAAAEQSAEEQALRSELEAEYRRELEVRVAQERERYQGSLRSLWMSSAAVWTVLLAFIVWQALSARKARRADG
jgi:hypothetical protein